MNAEEVKSIVKETVKEMILDGTIDLKIDYGHSILNSSRLVICFGDEREYNRFNGVETEDFEN